jgi:hypothetical protein
MSMSSDQESGIRIPGFHSHFLDPAGPGGRRQGRLRYLAGGSGAPLVLLHTVRTQAEHFRRLIPHLQDRYTVYALDLPGMGYSQIVPGASYDEPDMRTAVKDLLTRLGGQRLRLPRRDPQIQLPGTIHHYWHSGARHRPIPRRSRTQTDHDHRAPRRPVPAMPYRRIETMNNTGVPKADGRRLGCEACVSTTCGTPYATRLKAAGIPQGGSRPAHGSRERRDVGTIRRR